MVSKEEQRDSVSVVAEDAILAQVLSPTYRLFDLTDPSKGGTCVAIRFESNTYLATAGHVLCKGHHLVVGDKTGSTHFIEGLERIDRDDKHDLGLVTLSKAAAQEINPIDGMKFIGRISLKKKEFCYITGFPGEYIKPISKCAAGYCAFSPTGVSIPYGDIPEKLRGKVARNQTIVVEFDRTDQIVGHLPKNAANEKPVIDCPPPALFGISGAGVWAHSSKVGKGIWKPRPQLVGIQTGQLQAGKYICARPIRLWLELLTTVYSDLGADIRAILRKHSTRTEFVTRP